MSVPAAPADDAATEREQLLFDLRCHARDRSNLYGSLTRRAAAEIDSLVRQLAEARAERDEWKAKYEARAARFPTDTEFYGR